MSTTTTSRQNAASLLAAGAGLVSVTVLIIEGPPGSGYGWGSVAISATISAALFAVLALTVRSDSRGAAETCAVVAGATALLFIAALLGNWGSESAWFRTLDVIAAVTAVSASALALSVAVHTLRHSGPPSRTHRTVA